MKHNNILPFKLNMPYEELEFDLEPIQGYDSYQYIGQISIFGTVPKKVELIFYWERLKIIILEFEADDLPKVAKLTKLKFVKINDLYVKITFKIRHNQSIILISTIKCFIYCFHLLLY